MRRLFRIIFFVLIFFGIGLILVYCSVKKYTARSYNQAKLDKPYDVIIVPGVPYEGESTTQVMALRLFWAKHLYDSGYARNIIFSGSSVYSPYVEGKIMKIMADTLGVPHDHTFSETTAEHSTENAYYGWKMARSMGFQKIALATDPFQARSLESFIRKYCPGMKTIPVVRDVLDMDRVRLPAIDPAPAFVRDFIPIGRRESFWERWRGTMGKRVREDRDRQSDAQ